MKICHILKNNLFMISYIWRFSKSYIFLSILSSIDFTINPVIDILLMKVVVDSIAEGKPLINIMVFLVAVAGVNLFSAANDAYFNNRYYPKKDEEFSRKMQLMLLDKRRVCEVSCYENPEFYDSYMKAANEAQGRPLWVWGTVLGFLRNLFAIGAIGTIVIIIDPFIILFSLAGVLAGLFFSTKMGKVKFNFDMAKQPLERKKSYVNRIFYLPQYIKEVKLSSISNLLREMFVTSSKELVDVVHKWGGRVAWMDFAQTITSSTITVGAMGYLAYRIVSGNMSIGSFAAMLAATNQLRGYLQGLLQIVPDFYKHSLFIDNYRQFLEYVPLIDETKEGKEIDSMSSGIELKNVNFTYPNSDEQTLKNVSLSIKKGEKIAIVGHNGAGKTTLIKLLLRLYDPTNGEILLDNEVYKNFNVPKLRSKFSVVFQDYQCYAFTVAENVLMRKCETEEDELLVVESLKKSGLYDKISSLPMGIHTAVTKEFNAKGTLFSGGELQKLAIARVFANNSEIVILDEPSSALDPISEHNMHENMLAAAKDKTVILISHRLSTTLSADKIYFFEKGEIIESGTHNELLQKKGKYAEMFEVQAKKYKYNG
ncbi:MAG TPA: ABC transporter ATP-binding protein [Clostridiales bacterium]|nr:ABC transporter ATP-binding protein [Clostridiales bacterium]